MYQLLLHDRVAHSSPCKEAACTDASIDFLMSDPDKLMPLTEGLPCHDGKLSSNCWLACRERPLRTSHRRRRYAHRRRRNGGCSRRYLNPLRESKRKEAVFFHLQSERSFGYLAGKGVACLLEEFDRLRCCFRALGLPEL